jgi:gamma-glutamyltranspeptidase/glutathione hydrolase
VPLKTLLSKEHAQALCSEVDPDHASNRDPVATADATGDTIVLSTADDDGNMVSWVNSNFSGFGSGITVPGYGFVLHNRGGLFSLDPKSPNAIEPHKRPFNTLSAGFLMKDADPLMTLLLMGGDMQAQGHAQAVVNILDLGANLQAATDMARFHHVQISNGLAMESNLYDLVGKDLARMGHKVSAVDGGAVGGFQSILVMPPTPTASGAMPAHGIYRAGSDHRKDGQAVGW